jgi:membrane-anchored protein YejM (alkaline phosphatase superfamily)
MPLTHGPHEETPDPSFDGKPKATTPRKRLPSGYKTNVEYLDYLMGQLVSAIDEAGLKENTVFIFVGDNGTAGSGKGTVTELGVRVPLIIRWPGQARAGVVSRELVSVADIFPTLAELAGADLPKDHPIDGKSLVPTLRGEKKKHRDWLFSYLGESRILRTDRFVLEVPGQGQMGRMLDAGESRTGQGYKDVTGSSDPDVVGALQQFTLLLEELPGPENHPGLKQPGEGGKAKAKGKGKGKKAKAKAAEE